MINRYDRIKDIVQPVRQVLPAGTDILHPFKLGECLDNIATKYWGPDHVLDSWIIMCANPEFDNEFEIPFGTKIRVPYPLKRVTDAWFLNSEI